MAAKVGTKGKVLLTALVALVIFLVPAARALSPSPPAEGALTAPRAQAYMIGCGLSMGLAAWAVEFIAGFIIAVIGAIGSCLSLLGCGAASALCAVIDFVFTFIGVLCISIGVAPWLWAAYGSVAIAGLPQLIAVSCAQCIAAGVFGAVSAAPCPGNCWAGTLVQIVAWIFEAMAAVLGVVFMFIWAIPVVSIGFWVVALFWIVLGFFMWILSWPGTALLLVSNFLFAIVLCALVILTGFFLAILIFGILLMLGPLNVLFTLICAVLGIFTFLIFGSLGVCSFVGLGIIALLSKVAQMFCNYIAVPLVDLGVPCGGLSALTGPVNLITSMFGFFVMCIPGLCLTFTGIGAPVGIPMCFFGAITGWWYLIEGGITTFLAVVFEAPIIQNLCALWEVIFVGVLIYFWLDLIWWIFDLAVWIPYIFVGLCADFAIGLWIGVTSVLWTLALCPWGCAACSAVPSIISLLPCIAGALIGMVPDSCSWCLLNVQNQILWLWQRFFQSFAD